MAENRRAPGILDVTGTPSTPDVSPVAKFLFEQTAPLGPLPGAPQERFSPELEFILRNVAPSQPPAVQPPPPTPSIPGEFTTGVAAGFQRLVPTGAALAGVALRPFGFEEVATDMLKFAQEREEHIQMTYPQTVAF